MVFDYLCVDFFFDSVNFSLEFRCFLSKHFFHCGSFFLNLSLCFGIQFFCFCKESGCLFFGICPNLIELSQCIVKELVNFLIYLFLNVGNEFFIITDGSYELIRFYSDLRNLFGNSDFYFSILNLCFRHDFFSHFCFEFSLDEFYYCCLIDSVFRLLYSCFCLFFNGCDLLLIDAGFSEALWAENKPHLSARLAAETAREAEARHVTLTHFTPGSDLSVLLREARAVYPQAALAEAGLSVAF